MSARIFKAIQWIVCYGILAVLYELISGKRRWANIVVRMLDMAFILACFIWLTEP